MVNRIQFENIKLSLGIIGNSKPMLDAVERLVQVAPTDLTVLITGETGTGKDVFANAIHKLSKRKKFPYISVNCGAIPETLLEAELFGNEKGAFTGAIEQRKGYFEVANKGTIFLDEIGEMPVATQVKLLRILESGQFSRLGSSDNHKVDVRVISATNRNLEQEVSTGNFRQDLYFRLNSVHIILPPLREHSEDISQLVEYFAKRSCEKLNFEYQGISPETIQILQELRFPGNVRELRNLIETIVTLERSGYITPEMIRHYITPALPPHDLYASSGRTSLVPYSEYEVPPKFEMEIIFRTLLELKNDMTDMKRGLHGLSMQLEELKAEAIDAQSLVKFPNDNYDNDEYSEKYSFNLVEMEKLYIQKSLDEHRGNKRKAAKALGISERTLYRKIQEYSIEVD